MLACDRTARSGLARSRASAKTSGGRKPSESQGATSSLTPRSSSLRSGRRTALCSIPDVRTVMPGLRKPFSTMLRDSVTDEVKTAQRGSRRHPPSRSVSSSLQEKTRSRVCRSRSDAEPLATFAPLSTRKSYIARATHSGLGQVVAPLFMYIGMG